MQVPVEGATCKVLPTRAENSDSRDDRYQKKVQMRGKELCQQALKVKSGACSDITSGNNRQQASTTGKIGNNRQ